MYITKINLNNVRCFSMADVELGDKKTSLMITGDNGSGKSTMLRSIGMGLTDEDSTGALLRELQGDFVKNDNKREGDAIIEIELKENNSNQKYKIRTEIKTKPDLIYEYVEQNIYRKNENNRWVKLKDIHDFKWDKLFIVAYGAGLRTEGTEDYSQYFSTDAIYTLFKYTQPLQNAEIAWRRIKDVASKSGGMTKQKLINQINKEISSLLVKILGLDEKDKINLESNGIFIDSNWGIQELSSLGDAYKGIVNLILDILSWELLYKNIDRTFYSNDENNTSSWRPLGEFKRLRGIVLIDEIEQHLHPELQRKIIRRLTDELPGIQFIISTHSPLCVGGTSDAKRNSFKVFSACDDIDGKKIEENSIPYGLTADEIYIRYFGLTTTINTKIEEYLDEYRELYLYKDKDNELKKRENYLKRILAKNYPNSYAIEKDKIIKNEINERLNKIINKFKI